MTDLYAANRGICLPHIFRVFGLTYIPGADQHNARVANRAFVGPEHGLLNVECTPAQADNVRRYLVAVGFAEPQKPEHTQFPGGTFGLGAISPANARRSRLYRQLEAEGFELGDVHLLTGQRRLEARDGDVVELLRSINPDVLNRSWVRQYVVGKPQHDNWELTEFHVWVAIEFALEPELRISTIESAYDETTIPGVPARNILEMRLQRPNGKLVIVHNAAAIQRFQVDGSPSDPRHTTISCTLEVLARYPELFADDTDYLYISGNPHANRMVDDSQRVLKQHGRSPRLHLAATALLPAHERFVPLSLHELGMREHNAFLL